ncbi:MAG: hypothetical protein ABSH11_06410 [Verrucomicrobiota bacterium]|jgi:hypothetical protein
MRAPFQIICWEIAILVMITGCGTTPRYQGDGQIKNTSYFADANLLCYTRQYAIRLASFDMSTNFQKEFNLGELSSFREPKITVCIRFKDRHSWYHLRKAVKFDFRDIDGLKSRFGYRLSNQSRTLIAQPETLLKDYTWGGGQSDSEIGYEIEIRNDDQIRTRVPAGSKLKLWVSYTGDPSMTNRADFVVFWQW